MPSMLKAPERTFNVEEIIASYPFILVDNCILHPDYNLSEDLYMIKHADQLLRHTYRLQELIQSTQIMQGYAEKYKKLYLTPETKAEMTPFITHLRQVAAHNQARLEQQSSWPSKKNRPAFSRHDKRHNKLLERQREEEFDFSEYNGQVQQVINMINSAADSVVALSEVLPIYQSSAHLPRLPTLKASHTDAGIVSALADYAQQPENRKNTAAILTADGDLIRLFHTHLKAMPPAEQVDLSSRLAVHFKNYETKEYLRYEFHPHYQVRKEASSAGS